MLYSAFVDLADTTLGLGDVIIGDGSHSNVIIPFATLVGPDADSAATSLIANIPTAEYAIRTRDGADVEVSRQLSRHSLGRVMTTYLQLEAFDNGWTAPGFLVASLDATTGLFSIGYATGAIDISLTFTTAAGRNFLGFSGDVLGEIYHTGDQVPSYVIKPMLSACSNPTVDRESGTVASFAISDDGRHGYGLSREGAAVERDWEQQFEPLEKVEPVNAVSTHPWTHRHLLRHCRTGLPFVVTDGGFGNAEPELFHLRGEGTRWEADRTVKNRHSRRNIDYRTYVFGAIIAT